MDNSPDANFKAVQLDSAQAIASLTEAEFVSLLPENQELAKEVYRKAKDIKAKTQFLWANIKDTVASPHYRLMRASTVQESDRDALQRDFPNYQEMFGDLDYIDCDHCGSIFSPAGYFVDLMRLVEQYITIPNQSSIKAANGQTLSERRPDLADIELTCENTNTPIPSLQIINGILEKQIGLQELATAKYPFNLPLNFPLQQIRSYLGHLKTDLATIYETFGVDKLAIAREYLGLSPEEYNLITSPEADSDELRKLYGLEPRPENNRQTDAEIFPDTFLLQTGLSPLEITDLLKQNLHPSELNAGLAHNFFIYQNFTSDRSIDTATNQTTNPRVGLVRHWAMDEIHQDSSGTRLILDSVGNKHGALRGNATLESVAYFPFRIARNRRVLKLRGNGDRVSLGEQADLRFSGTAPYTMAAWIKPEAAGIIISKFNLSGSRSYFIKVQGDGKILAYRHFEPKLVFI